MIQKIFSSNISSKNSQKIKGWIFDIKRYAVHDGPGIRTTVFFKGCPLRCAWCHNPEGMDGAPQIMYRTEKCAEECSACVSVCSPQAICEEGEKIKIDASKCDLCGKCVDVCSYEALEISGREQTVEEVVTEIEKDRVFYEQSGGGVTISGGEPFLQPDFLETLLDELGERNIHTAVDTSGCVSAEVLERLYPKGDLFLYDIKIMDEKKHRQFTGVDNRQIFENLKILSQNEKPVIVRMPLISGVNDDQKNTADFAHFLSSLNFNHVHLLPFHKGWEKKYKRLQKESPQYDFQAPSDTQIEKIKIFLKDSGFSVKIGG